MSVVHRITGYGKKTEMLEVEYDVPDQQLLAIRTIAEVPAADEDASGSYGLSPDTAREIGCRLDRPIDVDGYDWFLEPFFERDRGR